MLNDLAAGYHQQARDTTVALEYFATAGISRDMVEEFQLGWVDEPLLAQHEGVVNMPVFPFVTVKGKVIQLRVDAFRQDMIGRHTDIVIGRNFPQPVPEHHLYNVRHTLPGLRSAQVVVTSDIRSCLIGRQAGWRTVAVPGYEHFYDPWLHLFDDAHVVLVWNQMESHVVEPLMHKFKHRGIEVLPMCLPDAETLASFLGPDIRHGSDIVDLLGSFTIKESES